MKRARLLGALTVLAVSAHGGSALAEEAPAEDTLPRPGLRFGLSLGEPLGATVAFPLSSAFWAQVHGGFSLADDRRGLFTADLVYSLEAAGGRVGSGALVPWFGLGGRFARQRGGTLDRAGLRVPFGLSYLEVLPSGASLELYASISPGLSLWPERRGSMDLTLGLRAGAF